MVLKANKPIQINANYRKTEKLLESGDIDIPSQLVAGDNITIVDGIISAEVPEPLIAGDNITIVDGVINGKSGSWVPLTEEEYYNGSIFDVATGELKNDILICIIYNAGGNQSYSVSTVEVPKMNEVLDPWVIISSWMETYNLGYFLLKLKELFVGTASALIEHSELRMPVTNGVCTLYTGSAGFYMLKCISNFPGRGYGYRIYKRE